MSPLDPTAPGNVQPDWWIADHPAAQDPAPPGAETTAGPPVEESSAPTAASADLAALEDWKNALRQDFERWLATLDAIPAAEVEAEPETPAPDLYDFFAELAALSSESRKSNRRTVEAVSQWNEVLGHFQSDLGRLREQITAPNANRTLPRAHCLAMIALLDRAERLDAAFQSPPATRWWAPDARWRQAWDTQRQGLDILRGHLAALLKAEGIARLDVLGRPFDPTLMAAVAAEPDAQHPPHTVLEEIAPGYRQHGELLRLAQVKVSVAPGAAATRP